MKTIEVCDDYAEVQGSDMKPFRDFTTTHTADYVILVVKDPKVCCLYVARRGGSDDDKVMFNKVIAFDECSGVMDRVLRFRLSPLELESRLREKFGVV